MQSDDDSIADKRFGKTEPTPKLEEHRLAKFCSDVAGDNQRPENIRAEASELYSEWCQLQHRRPHPAPKEQHATAKQLEVLYQRMGKFRSENL
jgi:hypothetical protein